MKPSLENRVENQQSKMRRSGTDRKFNIRDGVVVRDYRSDRDRWISSKIKYTKKVRLVQCRIVWKLRQG